MQSNALTPKCFIKSKQMRQLYQCGICYQVCIKPVRCRGSCQRIFCMKCVSDTKQNLDRCPHRCSSPFLVQTLPDIQVQFFCPYNPTLCSHSITSVKHFDSHHQHCQYVSPQELHLRNLQSQYKCLKEHQLQFYIGSYEEMVNSTCAACQEQQLCRSYCRICERFYCVGCRIPPCSKEGCPIGHSFNFQRIANINYICDICGISTAVSNDGVYDDNLCNFGICQACYSQMPATFDQSKPKALIANINTQCFCGTQLVYINTVHEPSQCQLCQKQKQCPKYCPNCQKRFCLGCKLMDIYSDSTCKLDHEIVRIQMLGHEQFMQKENHYGCMKCGQPSAAYYYDKHCKTRLCETCFGYSMKVTTDKQRPILTKCNKNHALMYINDPGDFYESCCGCQKTKIIKLACNYCGEDERLYCFECKQIKLDTCYYKHTLKFGKFQAARECHFCMKVGNEFHYCRKCFFFVCTGCMDHNLEKEWKEVGGVQPIEEEV